MQHHHQYQNHFHHRHYRHQDNNIFTKTITTTNYWKLSRKHHKTQLTFHHHQKIENKNEKILECVFQVLHNDHRHHICTLKISAISIPDICFVWNSFLCLDDYKTTCPGTVAVKDWVWTWALDLDKRMLNVRIFSENARPRTVKWTAQISTTRFSSQQL